MMSASTDTPLPRRSDELTWELLRDEWDLLLAVGTGPTGLETLVRRVETSAESLSPRLELLTRYGLLRKDPGGWCLVTAVYERREAMSSYVRELVLDRVGASATPPLDLAILTGGGEVAGLKQLNLTADETVLKEVVGIASAPEPDDAANFVVVFAATTLPVSSGDSRLQCALGALRGAALQRAQGQADGLARMWVAEMRVSPDVAVLIGERLAAFVDTQETTSFGGTLVTAVWPVSGSSRREVQN